MDDISYDENVDTLFLSDDTVFYTLEGEGRYVGMPSVFMRLAMCNLTCIGFKSADSPFGCDSYASWSVKTKYTFKELYTQFFEKTGYGSKIANGAAILKVTGGEPLIQQNQLVKFFKYLRDKKVLTIESLIDFETNATIIPSDAFFKTIDYSITFTTSPKLTSNGDPESKRYIPETLKWHVNRGSDFKFVVQNENDINEIIEKYTGKFNIPCQSVWLMPCCGSRQELFERSAQVAEWCKDFSFNFSPRLQLLIWNKALKV